MLDSTIEHSSVLLVAPQGSGKTQIAAQLMGALGLTTLIDEFDLAQWDPATPDGSLVLSSHMLGGVPSMVRVISLDEAKAFIRGNLSGQVAQRGAINA